MNALRDLTGRMLPHVPRLAVVIGLLAGPLAGCVDDDGSLVILHAKPIDTAQEGCPPTTDDNLFLSRGVVDVAMARNYVLFPSIQNNMPRTQEVKGFRTGDSRVDTPTPPT